MPEHIFKSPVKPGDRLWWASDTAAAGQGPALVQARMDDDPIEAVQFDSQDILVVSDRGRPEKIGEQYSCTDEASCIEWIKRNMPDAVLLKGQTVKAVHLDNCGNKNLIDLTCTVSEIERIFSSSSLASDSPDNEGTFAIYHEGANAENSQITTFLHDCMGNPVQAIYGEMLLVRAVPDPETGLLAMADLSEKMLAVIRDESMPAGHPAYDPSFWTCAEGMTIQELRGFLNQFPDNTTVHCCGGNQLSLHYCPETNAVNIDYESLADLPEYENHEPSGPHRPET